MHTTLARNFKKGRFSEAIIEGLDTQREWEFVESWFKRLQTTEKGRVIDHLSHLYFKELQKLRKSSKIDTNDSRHKNVTTNFVTPRNSRGRPSLISRGITIWAHFLFFFTNIGFAVECIWGLIKRIS